MSHVKLLLSGLPATGKTTLLQPLEDVLVIARDGKKYPFAQPHVNVPDFSSADEFIDLVFKKVGAYEEKVGELPRVIAIDSMSKILLDIEGYCLATIKSFPYGQVNVEIKKIVDFIERDLCDNFDVVLVSHALYNEDIGGFSLVNAGGSYGKKGGLLSEVDEALHLEVKGKKRTIHYRNSKMIARTTMADLPDSADAQDFNLAKHLDLLRSKQETAAEWSL